MEWENKHYANFFSPIFHRQKLALSRLAPYLKGKKVLEVGCGSGLLAKRILDLGAQTYIGLDLSNFAIEKAKKTYQSERISFKSLSLDELDYEEYDIIFSLGLIDWLDNHERSKLQELSFDKKYLHSFSAPLLGTQFLHRLYLKTYTAKIYRARIDDVKLMVDAFPGSNLYWNPKMYLSRFLERFE